MCDLCEAAMVPNDDNLDAHLRILRTFTFYLFVVSINVFNVVCVCVQNEMQWK